LSTIDEHAGRLAPAATRSADDGNLLESSQSATLTNQPNSRSGNAASRASQGRALAWEVVQTVLLTIAIFLSVRLVVQNFRVEGASMDTTLASGQFLLINKITYARVDGTPLESLVQPKNSRTSVHYLFGGPQRGDIVVFRSPGSADKDFIKRVIGLPGETVRIKDGRVYINDQQLDEPYIKHKATYDLDARKVPSDSFFVLGDNRPNSSDSHLGWYATADSIIGRAWISYWPPNLWGMLQSASYPNV
jgi:signal peptidase I